MKVTRVLVLLMLASPAMAQYIEPWCANKELRMKEASSLLSALRAMDKQVPVLSPAEEKWLDGEINSGDGKFTDRVLRAMGSREYDISIAKSQFARLLSDLQLLSDNKLSCKDEVLMWAEVASWIPDAKFWQAVESLVERKIVTKKSVEDFGHSFPAANATLRSQAILNGIVIPYLQGTMNCP